MLEYWLVVPEGSVRQYLVCARFLCSLTIVSTRIVVTRSKGVIIVILILFGSWTRVVICLFIRSLTGVRLWLVGIVLLILLWLTLSVLL